MKHLRTALAGLAISLLLTGCTTIGGSPQIAPRSPASAPGTTADGFCDGEVTSPGPCPPSAPPVGSTGRPSPVVTGTGSTTATATTATSRPSSTAENSGGLHFTVTGMLNSVPVPLPTGSNVHPYVEREGLTVDLPGPGHVLLQAFGKSGKSETAAAVMAKFIAPGRFYQADDIHREVRPVSPVRVSCPGRAGTFTLEQLINRVGTQYDMAATYITDKSSESLDLVVAVVSRQHGTIIFVVSGDAGDYANVQNGLYLSVFGLMTSLDNYAVG